MSKIEWTEETWNPVTGCRKVSPGCAHCYAERMAVRLASMGRTGYPEAVTERGRWSGEAAVVTDAIGKPLTWTKPKRVFVCSMSDLFFEEHATDTIISILAVIAQAHRHTFQVLTKRTDRMRALFNDQQFVTEVWRHAGIDALIQVSGAGIIGKSKHWPLPNLQVGASIEDNDRLLYRWEDLVRTPAVCRFVSAEPLLEDIGVELETRLIGACSICGYSAGAGSEESPSCPCGSNDCPHPGVHQVIVGGESGPGARGCDPEWIKRIVAACRHAGVGCFVKQLGADWAKRFGSKTAKGNNPDEWPVGLRVRQEPIL